MGYYGQSGGDARLQAVRSPSRPYTRLCHGGWYFDSDEEYAQQCIDAVEEGFSVVGSR